LGGTLICEADDTGRSEGLVGLTDLLVTDVPIAVKLPLGSVELTLLLDGVVVEGLFSGEVGLAKPLVRTDP